MLKKAKTKKEYLDKGIIEIQELTIGQSIELQKEGEEALLKSIEFSTTDRTITLDYIKGLPVKYTKELLELMAEINKLNDIK